MPLESVLAHVCACACVRVCLHSLSVWYCVPCPTSSGAFVALSTKLPPSVTPSPLLSLSLPLPTRYVRGGIFTQVKQPKTVKFKPLSTSLSDPICDTPMMGLTDYGKFERPMQLHVAFQAVDAFKKETGSLPQPGDAAAGAAVVVHAKKIAAALANPVEVDEKLVATFASQAMGSMIAVCGFIGGVAAQEVMKACSGKFSPIVQHLYFDALEALPGDGSAPLDPALLQPKGNRYDGQTVVIGSELQAKLGAATYFLVGAGAIGCELLKNFAMMGLATSGGGGEVVVTDMDIIETSNLNRQFLFRPKDVKQPKSHTAAAAAKVMNPEFNCVAHENQVGADTEETYGDAFFAKLDGVANALDNVEARQYMDRRCVFYGKPLLESGTLGSKGNTQVVLPHMTESYSSTQDPPEASIPLCTLKNFPYKPEHVLQWARDNFEGTFAQEPAYINSYLADSAFVEGLLKQPGSQPMDTLKSIATNLVDAKPLSFEDCMAWARLQFQDMFHNSIAQLLHNFPADQVTKEGTLFWSGTKRCPHPLEFDDSDAIHLDFVLAAARLRADVYGLKPSEDLAAVKAMLAKVAIVPFKPKEVKIAANDAEAKELAAAAAAAAAAEDPVEILKTIPAPATLAGYRVNPLEFEKDEDENGHIKYIAACGNLRGMCYNLEPVSNHNAKMIAGKIIPAIATTTACVVRLQIKGFDSREVWHVARGCEVAVGVRGVVWFVRMCGCLGILRPWCSGNRAANSLHVLCPPSLEGRARSQGVQFLLCRPCARVCVCVWGGGLATALHRLSFSDETLFFGCIFFCYRSFEFLRECKGWSGWHRAAESGWRQGQSGRLQELICKPGAEYLRACRTGGVRKAKVQRC